MNSDGRNHHKILFSIAHAPAIFPPGHLRRIRRKVLAADMVMSANLGAAEAGEKRLRLVRAGRADEAQASYRTIRPWSIVGRHYIHQRA